MPHLISTYRPFEFTKGICYINSGSRQKQRSPFDHDAYLEDEIIYESVVGEGVHKIPFEEWKKGREGTHLFMHEVPKGVFSLTVFEELENRKYDISANAWQLFGWTRLLALKPNYKLYCSELMAAMLFIDNAHLYTPRMIFELMDNEHYPLTHKII